MAGGSWQPGVSPGRPGLYINFVQAAVAQIKGGTLGTVAIPLKSATGGTAIAKNFYTVETESDAAAKFGAANIQSIKFALQGGAKEVLVYVMPAAPTATDYDDMRTAFDARPFNVFVYDGEVSSTEQDNTITWVTRNKGEGKHFLVVFGGSNADDADPAVGDARSIRLLHDYAVNLISGVVTGGTAYSSGAYAAYVAGLIAGTAINKSTTYAKVPVDDVTKRLTNAQIKTSLSKGSLVLVHDGEKVKVERGITTSVKKIRKIRVEQAISNDITRTANDEYIGKVDNNVTGQEALISAIKRYLEELAANNVLDPNSINVALDPQYQSVGDKVYLLISIIEIDSMEEIYLTINV